MKKIMLTIISLFLLITSVKAESICTYKEQAVINQKAANVKVNYDVVEETEQVDKNDGHEEMFLTSYYFKISILNVSEDLYVVVKNNQSEKEYTYTHEDAEDGVIEFFWLYADEVTNFTIQVYTTDKTSCPDERYKTIYLTTPRYNEFYDMGACQKDPDFYLCQQFVTFGEIKEEQFLKQIESYRNGDVDNSGEQIKDNDDSTISDNIIDFINEYKWYIVGGLCIIFIIILLIDKKNKKKLKKQRDLGL